MTISKRQFLQSLAAGVTAWGVGARRGAGAASAPRTYRRIACEEAFATPEVIAELSRLAGGKASMKSGPIAGPFMPDLLDLGERRLQGMDAAGIDMQLLTLVSPGVQLFAPGTALALARDVNDRLADAVRAHPTRFAGLAAGRGRVREGTRARGHAPGRAAAWSTAHQRRVPTIRNTAVARGRPARRAAPHPSARPSPGSSSRWRCRHAVGWGYAVETGTHAVRLMGAGIFDRHPRLRIVLGHLRTLPLLLDR
jgi:2,3-dihydroxybenzoate decarboxylase